MTSSASKRLFKEYRGLSSDPPEGITAGPVTEDDMFVWEALIQGPEDTPFEGGVFPAELKFPKDYPLAPPKMKFLVDMWHPNGTCALLSTKREHGTGAYVEPSADSIQCIPTAKYAFPSCTRQATTRTTTSKPPSAGRPSRASRRSSSVL